MAVGYDVVVESVDDIRKGEWFIVVVTEKGISLRDKDGKVVTSVLYPYLKLKVLKVFKHMPFIQVFNGNSCKKLEYKSLSEAKNAYRLFRLAVKNSKLDYTEQCVRVAPVNSLTPDSEINKIIPRVCLRIKSDEFEIVFIPLEHTYVVDDWAKEKIGKTFMEVRW